jgi:hypothetical protein
MLPPPPSTTHSRTSCLPGCADCVLLTGAAQREPCHAECRMQLERLLRVAAFHLAARQHSNTCLPAFSRTPPNPGLCRLCFRGAQRAQRGRCQSTGGSASSTALAPAPAAWRGGGCRGRPMLWRGPAGDSVPSAGCASHTAHPRAAPQPQRRWKQGRRRGRRRRGWRSVQPAAAAPCWAPGGARMVARLVAAVAGAGRAAGGASLSRARSRRNT